MDRLWETLAALLGVGQDAALLGPGQVALRALVVYGLTLLIVRLGSKRLMGKATAFDVILAIMLGSIMSRAITGSEGLLPTFIAGAVLVGLHWLFGVVALRSDRFGRLVKGEPVRIVEDGKVLDDAMRGSHLTRRDLEEALRLEGIHPDPSRIALAHLERDGTISVVPRDREPHVVDLGVVDGVRTVQIRFG